MGTVISRALAFAGSVVVARILSPVNFGQLAVIQSTGVLATGLISGGLAVTATHFVAMHRERSPAVSIHHGVSAIMLAFYGGLLGAFMVCLLAGPIARYILVDAALVHGLTLSALYILFSSVSGVALGLLYGLNEFPQASAIAILRAALMVVLQVAGSLRWGMDGAVAGLVASEAIVLLYICIVVVRVVRRTGYTGRWWPTRSSARELLSFSVPALLASTATQPALWLTGILLAREVDGYAAVALFNVADRFRQILVFLPSTLSPIALSYLSTFHGQGDSGGFRIVLKWNIIASIAFVLPPTALVLLFASEALSLYGPDYAGGTTTLMVLAGSSIFVALNNVLGQTLVSTGRIWWRFAFDAMLAGVLICCGYLLVPALMSEGLAHTHFIAYGVVTVGLALFLRWSPLQKPVP
jgi:O-antigen/teichoic acid export membrane protein